MIDVRVRDRAKLAGLMYVWCGRVSQLEAFDLVDRVFSYLDQEGYSLLRKELAHSLTAAAVGSIDPTTLPPVVDRSVVVPYLEECGWKRGEPWTVQP